VGIVATVDGSEAALPLYFAENLCFSDMLQLTCGSAAATRRQSRKEYDYVHGKAQLFRK